MNPAYWVIGLIVVAVIGYASWAAFGKLGSMPEMVDDIPGPDLPEEGLLSGSDIRGVRFALVARGYSQQQVDALLTRVADQLDSAQSEERSPADLETAPEVGDRPSDAE